MLGAFKIVMTTATLLIIVQVFSAAVTIIWLSILVDLINISFTSYTVTIISILSTATGTASYIMWKGRKKKLSEPSVILPADSGIPVKELCLEIQQQTEAIVYLEEQLNKTYSRFNLRECLSSRYIVQIEQYFTQKKPYLDPELTMKKAADELHIPLHHLSIVLNDKFGHTFSDYVNMHRIAEVKCRLKSQPHVKIESIAYECGFNSKATFNRVFKKYCRQTPSAYQKAVATC